MFERLLRIAEKLLGLWIHPGVDLDDQHACERRGGMAVFLVDTDDGVSVLRDVCIILEQCNAYTRYLIFSLAS